MPTEERSNCEDCGLEFDAGELNVDGLCPECALDEADEEDPDLEP